MCDLEKYIPNTALLKIDFCVYVDISIDGTIKLDSRNSYLWFWKNLQWTNNFIVPKFDSNFIKMVYYLFHFIPVVCHHDRTEVWESDNDLKEKKKTFIFIFFLM